jgi:hypothetical protein
MVRRFRASFESRWPGYSQNPAKHLCCFLSNDITFLKLMSWGGGEGLSRFRYCTEVVGLDKICVFKRLVRA